MTIHRRFGENLRDLCYKFASISEVCDGIGINRQQFNKYLSGQCMPNALTLRKICLFLNTSEEHLFSLPIGVAANQRPSISPRPPELKDAFKVIAERLKRSVRASPLDGIQAVQLGYYFCYFPLQNSTGFLHRSLVKISHFEGITHFSRLTRFPSHSKKHRFLARGKHIGLVTANERDVYFIGLNRMSPKQLSFMTFEKMNVGSQRYMNGLAIVHSGSGSLAIRSCMEYLGPTINLRSMLTRLGPLSVASPNLDPFVHAAMSNRPEPSNYITAINFDELLSRTIDKPTDREVSLITT